MLVISIQEAAPTPKKPQVAGKNGTVKKGKVDSSSSSSDEDSDESDDESDKVRSFA